jgi:hypothetical protein
VSFLPIDRLETEAAPLKALAKGRLANMPSGREAIVAAPTPNAIFAVADELAEVAAERST